MHKDYEALDCLTIRRYVCAEVKSLIPGIEHELLRLFTPGTPEAEGGERRQDSNKTEKKVRDDYICANAYEDGRGSDNIGDNTSGLTTFSVCPPLSRSFCCGKVTYTICSRSPDT